MIETKSAYASGRLDPRAGSEAHSWLEQDRSAHSHTSEPPNRLKHPSSGDHLLVSTPALPLVIVRAEESGGCHGSIGNRVTPNSGRGKRLL